MTVPIPSHLPAGATDADTEEMFLPPLAGAAETSAPTTADADVTTARRLDWFIVLAVLFLALAGTVALLVTLWLQPGSGSVGS